MSIETSERDFGLHFACHTDKGDVTTVTAFCSVTLLLVHMNNVDIFPLLFDSLGGPAVTDKTMQPPV